LIPARKPPWTRRSRPAPQPSRYRSRSSLIAFSSNAESAIGEAMKRAFEAAGLPARIYQLKMSDHGAEVHIQKT